MQKLGFQSSMKSLDQFKTLTGSTTTRNLAFSFSSSRPSSDSSASAIYSGSFANLKLTAEKLVKEQASVKTDLDMANGKLKKSTEHIHALEEKLQSAFNENAKLKVKQKEDEKLWKGLESKFSSTKILSDQLTETLQLLASQVQNAEKDKEFFEGKLSASSSSIDDLNQQLKALSLKLSSAEKNVADCEKELEDLRKEREEKNKLYTEEKSKAANLIAEKDNMLKRFEADLAAQRLAIENMNSKLGVLQHDLTLKEEEVKHLVITQKQLQKEKDDLQSSSNDFEDKLAKSLQDIKILEDFVHASSAQLGEADKRILDFSVKFDELNSLYETSFKLVQEEKELAAKLAQTQYAQLHDKFLHIVSEKDTLRDVNDELCNKISELQKDQDSVTQQLSKERNSAAERTRRLESEAEVLMSKNHETENLASKLKEEIESLTKSLRLTEDKMQNLLAKISAMEIENKESTEKLKCETQKKVEEIDLLQIDIDKQRHCVDSLEKQVDQLSSALDEKEQLILQHKDREKQLQDQVTEVQALLATAETKLAEAKKQYDMMLESKQMELSRHLKEISQRNDQAINDIWKKYEVEKLKIINMEKEKAEKLIQETERNFDQKLAQSEEDSKKQMVRIQEEHASMVVHIQQERDRNEMNLKATHDEEIKQLREKMQQLRNEHEVQMKALRCQHEDECRTYQEQLDLQKSKEDRQRALLQLQWKVMGVKPQDEQEVTSKKNYSISSSKIRNAGVRETTQALDDLPYMAATQSPVSKILKKVNNANTESVMSIPKHHQKVTHHEYEVETTNGTIMKRRKTRSTVMFEDPRKQKKMRTPKDTTPKAVIKKIKDGSHSRPSNIGDLFSEGSLNPYADDPYAFD